MFNALRRFFNQRLGSPTNRANAVDAPDSVNDLEGPTAAAATQDHAMLDAVHEPVTAERADQVVLFDENLLERCRILWQQGDWEGLKFLDRDMLQHHPDRPRLALLAAAAHQQTGSMDEARIWLRLARDWGCSKQLISQIMISGVYNTLARASVAFGQMERAQLHFEGAMRCAVPKGNVAQLTQARIATQLPGLGIPVLAAPQDTPAAQMAEASAETTDTPEERQATASAQPT